MSLFERAMAQLYSAGAFVTPDGIFWGGNCAPYYFGETLCRIARAVYNAKSTGAIADPVARAFVDLQRLGRCAPELGGYSDADCQAASAIAPSALGPAYRPTPEPEAALVAVPVAAPTAFQETTRACPVTHPVATIDQYGQLICKAESAAEIETAVSEGAPAPAPVSLSPLTRIAEWAQERSVTQAAPNWVLPVAAGLGAWALYRRSL
jgi:hypothetical protein